MLPDVSNLKGLDIGCGEGYNTRIAAKKGAHMTAIDISKVFIKYAKEAEQQEPLGIKYQLVDAVKVPFPNNRFDFAIATMSLMDIPNAESVIAESFRVINPKGFFQFSITHPFVSNSKYKWIRNEEGKKIGFIVEDYLKNLMVNLKNRFLVQLQKN